jgi:hypothetical protein
MMLALALCWQFNVLMSWEGVLVGLTVTSAASAALLLLPEALLIRTFATDRLARKASTPAAPPQYGDRQPHQDASAPSVKVDVDVVPQGA